jgi:hypothetical protein
MPLVDRRKESAVQLQLQSLADNSPRAARQEAVQRKANRTGLPDQLKAGIESLSGFDMDHVNVHYNSERPAQLQAHAYAQGSDIHVGPGQEKHLPHEAWHVVQQAQGRVRATMQMAGQHVNDDIRLEQEADAMGTKAAGLGAVGAPAAGRTRSFSTPAGNAPIQGAFTSSTYRLASNQSRQMFVEAGSYVNRNPAAGALKRAVLHETMVVLGNADATATRFQQAAANYPAGSVGLSIAINKSYDKPSEIAAAQGLLTTKAAQIERAAHPPINVVKVLWQDGRADKSGSIRPEVPFAELRRHAATDQGSSNMYAELSTQAATVWRKMGDDDMPFDNPNADSEVNSELARLEKGNETLDRGNLASFSYTLIPDSRDPTIVELCAHIYRKEAATIAEVTSEQRIRAYAIEPTTYYRGAYGEDGAAEWNAYEAQATAGSKQIKEGASFAKALRGEYATQPEYIELNQPMPTADGGRLDKIVAILGNALNLAEEVDESALYVALDEALPAVDQSIWDLKTLTRGSGWMYREGEQDPNHGESLEKTNGIIKTNYTILLAELVKKVITENRRRRRERRV